MIENDSNEGKPVNLNTGEPDNSEASATNPYLEEANRRFQRLLKDGESAEARIRMQLLYSGSSNVRQSTYNNPVSNKTGEDLHETCISWPQRECDYCEANEMLIDGFEEALRLRGLEEGSGVVRLEKGKPPRVILD